jgi:hypothetical protein
MSSPVTIVNKCAICGDLAPRICGGCKDASYCTTECQHTDWKMHKLICSSFKHFATPPKPDMHRALLFEFNKEKPRFVWFESYNKPSLKALVGGNYRTLQLSSVNPVRNRKLGNSIRALHLEEFQPSNETINQSLMGSVIGSCKKWYGLPLEKTV